MHQYNLHVRLFLLSWLLRNQSMVSARAILNIVEYFVNLDLAQLSAIVDKDLMVSLQARPLNLTLQSVGEISAGN